MPFTRTNWMNYSPPAINAANLLNMEDGIWYGLAHSGGVRNTAEFLDRNPASTTGGLAEAIADLGGSPGVVFAAPHNHPIPAGGIPADTIPATVHLIVSRGAILNIANGVTLTINGTIEAGLYQIFVLVGTGTVAFTATTGHIREVYPEWWGAVGDGVADDASEIESAHTSLPSRGGKVLFRSASYLIGTGNELTLTLAYRVWEGAGQEVTYIRYFGAGTAITFNPAVSTQRMTWRDLTFRGDSGASPRVGTALHIQDSLGSELENVAFAHFDTEIHFSNDAHYTLLKNCFFTSTEYCVKGTYPASNQCFVDCEFRGGETNPIESTLTIDTAMCNGWVFIGGCFEAYGLGTLKVASNFQFLGTRFEGLAVGNWIEVHGSRNRFNCSYHALENAVVGNYYPDPLFKFLNGASYNVVNPIHLAHPWPIAKFESGARQNKIVVNSDEFDFLDGVGNDNYTWSSHQDKFIIDENDEGAGNRVIEVGSGLVGGVTEVFEYEQYDQRFMRGLARLENICLRSEALDTNPAPWWNRDLAVVANDANDPFGNLTAERLTAPGAPGNHDILQDCGASVATEHWTFSVWLRSGGAVDCELILGVSGDRGDPITVPTTWTRYSLSRYGMALASTWVGIRVSNDNDVVWAWGAQVVKKNLMGVYISTAAAAVESTNPVYP